MKKSISLTVITLLLAVSSLSAATHYVSLESTNPTPPYTNWATAATNIQQALGAAAAGDEIVVTNGVYEVGQTDVGNGPSRVAVTNAISLRSVNGPQFTVIDGRGWNRCVSLADGASLCGFTLTNGLAHYGGGEQERVGPLVSRSGEEMTILVHGSQAVQLRLCEAR